MSELKDYWKDHPSENIIRVETPHGGYYTKYEDLINMNIFFDKLEQEAINKSTKQLFNNGR
jgi:hypothetical protein